MIRKTRRSLKVHGGELEQAIGWIDELILKLQRNNLLDDAAFARMKANSLRASGKSKRMIAMKLKMKGVPDDLVASHVQRVTTESSEEEAAQVHARKKRLGPYRTNEELRKEKREKDMAALARAGFSYSVAKKVIDGTEWD
jgi:regulatory protein